MPDEDGDTRLERNERVGHEGPPEPEIPDEFAFLLEAFWDLNQRRQSNGYELQPIQWLEYEAWERGTGNLLTHDERLIVMRLPTIFDQAVIDNRPKKKES